MVFYCDVVNSPTLRPDTSGFDHNPQIAAPDTSDSLPADGFSSAPLDRLAPSYKPDGSDPYLNKRASGAPKIYKKKPGLLVNRFKYGNGEVGGAETGLNLYLGPLAAGGAGAGPLAYPGAHANFSANFSKMVDIYGLGSMSGQLFLTESVARLSTDGAGIFLNVGLTHGFLALFPGYYATDAAPAPELALNLGGVVSLVY